MIARLWKGESTEELGPRYEQHLLTETFPALERIGGFCGAFILRQEPDDGTVTYLIMTLWSDQEAIEAFAGPDDDLAVVPPGAQAVLTRYDEHVDHAVVVAAPSQLQRS